MPPWLVLRTLRLLRRPPGWTRIAAERGIRIR